MNMISKLTKSIDDASIHVKEQQDWLKVYFSKGKSGRKRMFYTSKYIEPQVHCNYWPIDTKGPQGFEEKESKWKNYFLFEPNVFLGINF